MAGTKASDAVTDETFMTLLRRHRLARGLTQTALAKRLKLKTPSTISYWESGQSLPSPQWIPKLARVLGVDAMELTRIIEPQSSNPGADAK